MMNPGTFLSLLAFYNGLDLADILKQQYSYRKPQNEADKPEETCAGEQGDQSEPFCHEAIVRSTTHLSNPAGLHQELSLNEK